MTDATLQATSDFSRQSRLTQLLRTSLRAAQQLWPALGVRAAHRLFGTPLPPKWANRRQPWRSALHWQTEHWAFEQASVTVYPALASPLPAGAGRQVVLLVHGWGGHAAQLLPLAELLAARGLAPVLVDLPAHGQSAGRTSNLPQFARAIDYVAARLQAQGHTLHAVIAHSLAANAAAYAAARGLPADKLVLLAPPASPRDYTRLFAGVFGLTETTRAAMQQRIEAREGILMAQFEPAAVGPRIQADTLVVHDRDDRINRFADGQSYHLSIAASQFMATSGLGHRRILKDPAVLARVAAFVAG